MAITNTPHLVEGHEGVPSSVDQGLRGLTGKLVNTGKKHIGAVLLGAAAMMTTPSIASAETPASSSPSAIASADKGGGQYTQDGRNFSSLNEADVDGLSDMDFDKYNKWKIAKKQEANVSLDGEIAKKQEAAIKDTGDWWKKTQPLLASLPQAKVIAFLKTDVEGNKKLLQFIVDNQLPPPGYAEKLLHLI